MEYKKSLDRALKICTAAVLVLALVLSFTLSDYYIFNRLNEFSQIFAVSQWIKKAGLLLLPLAVFYKKKCCADIAKYVLPVAVIASCFTFGNFFDVTYVTAESTGEQIALAHLNEFMPKWLNIAAFSLSGGLELSICAMLFMRDGFRVKAKSFAYLPFAVAAVIPLNIFENFFDVKDFTTEHFLWFKNFTLWHFLAILFLVGFTVGAYYFLKRKDEKTKNDYLVAAAIVLLIQYHCKDSMLLGDGYNVYYTVFSVLPLFICNIGVYISCLSVILRKKFLYATSFFVHAVGALTVFVYFGKNEMSNYGIIGSYSILYFIVTHCLLFALCVLPSALGQYKFKPKDCIAPLIYYCVVIVVAAVASGLVDSYLHEYNYGGFGLPDYALDKPPNFAFTQVCPLPVTLPSIPIKIWNCELNLFYLILLYAAYVCLFWAFTGAYYAFIAVRKRTLAWVAKRRAAAKSAGEATDGATDTVTETAAADNTVSVDGAAGEIAAAEGESTYSGGKNSDNADAEESLELAK